MRTSHVLSVLSALSVLSVPASAQDSEKDFTWSKALAAGKTIEIKGISGGIQAKPATGREASVTGVKRWRRGDPSSVEIKVVEHADGVTICAVWVNRDGSCEPGDNSRHGGRNNGNNWDNDRNDVSVEFTVMVPQGVALEASTVNGNVRATGLSGDVEASSVNGSVEVGTSGAASGSTVNGDLRVSMGKANWTGEQEYNTVNGSVIIDMPASSEFDLRAETVNGSIDSDFPITLQGKVNPRKLRGTVGKGGRTLSASTVNGSIELRKGT